MSAVWTASRAAVARRRLQTFVLGVVVLVASGTAVVTLGLAAAVSGPFDKAYNAVNGAHTVAEFDRAKATDAQIARTARVPGVEAAAGPYPVAVLRRPTDSGGPFGLPGVFTVVGRDRPDTAVDTMKVFSGRWAERPGEIVLDLPDGFGGRRLIDQETHVLAPGGVDLKVVGYATSASRSAGGWVTPGQAVQLGAATTQMMYRFRDAGSAAALTADMAAVTAGLPPGSLTGTGSYLTLKARLAAGPNTYVPFLTAFGILGLAVSVLIVGNAVSGAVVAGYRHIGIMKALGFTSNQVTAVYLVMVLLPAAVGCAIGTAAGSYLGTSMVRGAFWGISGNSLVAGKTGVPPWVYAVVLLGMPALVAVSAFLPALRARRLPAARAISAGSVQRTGRGLAVQRRLGGSPLPRPLSLGLGWPFARPARTALTLSTVVAGVTTVTLALGLTSSVLAYNRSRDEQDRIQVTIAVDNPSAPGHPPAPAHSDGRLLALLRGLPGAAHVAAQTVVQTRMAGSADTVRLGVETGDSTALQPGLVRGRWPAGPGEVVANSAFWHQHRLALGGTVVLRDTAGRQVRERVVGEQTDGWDLTSTDWNRFVGLGRTGRAMTFSVGLAKGADPHAYARRAGALDPGVQASVNAGVGSVEQAMISVISTVTALLVALCGLGVFNAVVLNTRERRRDIGVLKAIGMTPRQVIAVVVSAMAALGLAGGLAGVPLGVLAHRTVIPILGRGTGRDLPAALLHVWHWPVVAPLALSGCALAVLGAFIPSARASRSSPAEVLRTE
ncbi:MAG: ABC transporter permease [Streptomyces sp.]|nr:ABC transporter permease [Streptomyces sp.]